jgi:hypothetical protein
MIESSQEYRQLVVKLLEAGQPKRTTKFPFRESVDTIILGLLSTGIGFFALFLVVWAMFGKHVEMFQTVKTASGDGSGVTKTIITPEPVLYFAVVAGYCLGLAGILAARRRRATISILSALGTAICLLSMIFQGIYILVKTKMM